MNAQHLYAVCIHSLPGIGHKILRQILEIYANDAQKAWENRAHWSSKLEKKALDFPAILEKSDTIDPEKVASYCEKNGIRVVMLGESEYPYLLSQIVDPPFLLYYKGNLDSQKLWDKSLAVVGSRKMSQDYGERVVRTLVPGLVQAGFTIVSGGAYGVDSCAHRCCIDAGGRTVAVLGTGIETVYPKSNAQLYSDIVQT